MKLRKVPLRKCIACGENKSKKELIRIVKNTDNEVIIDIKGKANGRGTYICPNLTCFEIAHKSKKIDKALEINTNEEIYNELREIINGR